MYPVIFKIFSYEKQYLLYKVQKIKINYETKSKHNKIVTKILIYFIHYYIV